jgi:hypothetical protein
MDPLNPRTKAAQPPSKAQAPTGNVASAAACLTALAYHARPGRYRPGRHATIRLLRTLTPHACARTALPTDEATRTRVLAAAINALLHVSGVRPGELARYLDAVTAKQRRDLLNHAHRFLTTTPITAHSKD